MNPSPEQNHQKSHLHTSSLINLFQQKGYDCKKISRDNETIYVMKFERLNDHPLSEPKSKITAH
jgi:hypothetical protein